jgi:hypothetical protein
MGRRGEERWATSGVHVLGSVRPRDGAWILILVLRSSSGIPVGEQILSPMHHEVRVGSRSRLDVLWRCVGQCVCVWGRGGGWVVPVHVKLRAKN